MAAANIPITDISGNDEIFLTALLPPSALIGGTQNFVMQLGERPGWRRVGVTVRVADLPAIIRNVQGSGGTVEHVHDY